METTRRQFMTTVGAATTVLTADRVAKPKRSSGTPSQQHSKYSFGCYGSESAGGEMSDVEGRQAVVDWGILSRRAVKVFHPILTPWRFLPPSLEEDMELL